MCYYKERNFNLRGTVVGLFTESNLFPPNMNSFFYLELKIGGSMIQNIMVFFRNLQMFEYARGSISVHVPTYVCGKMPGGFANVTDISAHTKKFLYNTRTEPSWL